MSTAFRVRIAQALRYTGVMHKLRRLRLDVPLHALHRIQKSAYVSGRIDLLTGCLRAQIRRQLPRRCVLTHDGEVAATVGLHLCLQGGLVARQAERGMTRKLARAVEAPV